ncbi:hypothetical protein K9N68_37365 (plasmid) [Kovacikia minuta CCNUW1]|uniref:hypothetical protein n=1 Tax=Kovacikia minuta TaxID=2931930 RepID=UPI001CCF007C|nr:hypothetical protein [Kovacikia minuta]UBF29883.1 hypothetical protein K9N68_37365 [Kovacikia minuta CCNUW1]
MSINFGQLAKEIQEKNGYCLLSPHHYAKIRGVRIHNRTEEKTDVLIPWIIEECEGRKVLKLLEGVTGWEAWYVEDIKKFPPDTETFAACAGTPGRWDTLLVNSADVMEVVRLVG